MMSAIRKELLTRRRLRLGELLLGTTSVRRTNHITPRLEGILLCKLEGNNGALRERPVRA